MQLSEANSPVLSSSTKTHIIQHISTAKGKTAEMKATSASKDNRIKYFRYGIAASIFLLLISSITNIFLMKQMRDMSAEISRMNKENTYMAAEMKDQKNTLAKMNLHMGVVTNPQNEIVTMKGMDVSPSSMATVYWNKTSSEVYLMVNNLVAPPSDKQYQLWAIVDGKPVDAGVFSMNDDMGLQSMKNIQNATAFAVTLEKMGGSPTPTLEAMYLMGEV